jgi:hypothetical protein
MGMNNQRDTAVKKVRGGVRESEDGDVTTGS